MAMLFDLLRPAIFALDPERAHGLTVAALKTMPAGPKPVPGALACDVAGLTFPNPVGLAAGFDKNGEVPDAMLGLGFGAVEVGSITPRPQEGNPRPRLFRLIEDRAVINRMGFNNRGGEEAAARLSARKHRGGIVGINVGANKDSADRVADYAAMTRLMAPLASYLAINISSPNTPGLRALQDEGALVGLIEGGMEARAEVCRYRRDRPDRPRHRARGADRLEHHDFPPRPLFTAPRGDGRPVRRALARACSPANPRFPRGDRWRHPARRRGRHRQCRGRLGAHPRRGQPGAALLRPRLRRTRPCAPDRGRP